MVLGGPARQIDENLAILKRPRADRHHSENRLFVAGVKLRSLRKVTSPVSEQADLRRRP